MSDSLFFYLFFPQFDRHIPSAIMVVDESLLHGGTQLSNSCMARPTANRIEGAHKEDDLDKERNDEESLGSDSKALCLSGGGYRAMLFHLGTLWRLNDASYLRTLTRISSVSGGSLAAGVLGMAWNDLSFNSEGQCTNFDEKIVKPLMGMAQHTVDVWAVLGGLLGPGSVNRRVTATYRRLLFGHKTLQDLPSGENKPRFIFNATNIQSGALARFSKPYIWDYRVGKVPDPRNELAEVVAASSAFPPILSPAVIRFADHAFEPQTGKDLQCPPYTRRMVLSDGGVYDNLGLETAWKSCGTVLVSDAGGQFQPDPRPKRFWLTHTIRVLAVIDHQVRSLRKRELIDRYIQGVLRGAYWGIGTDIKNYKVPCLPCPYARTQELAHVATRLKRLPISTSERLVNWGYAVCDAALRAHVDTTIPPAQGFPFPEREV